MSEVGKAVTPLEHLHETVLHEPGRSGLERGALARAVGSQERHDASGGHLERDSSKADDDTVVDDLDILEREERGLQSCHGGLRSGCGRD
jgi:hypothetical protein